MSQAITFIECKKIRFQNGKKGLATAVLDQLYDSISKEGLFNPIVVRPDPEAAGYYHIVQGRLRFYVVAKMCKDEVIACRVFADMSAEEAELATLTEDACRKNAKQTDRLLMLRRWQEIYRKHFPHLEGKKASGSLRWSNSTKAEAKAKAVADEKADDEKAATEDLVITDSVITQHEEEAIEVEPGVEAEHEAVVDPGRKAAHQTFRDRVKAVTGISDTTLNRELKINRGLTEEQIFCLDAVQCTRHQMVEIIDATPDDEAKRGEIVSLVASGMDVERALAEVLETATATEAVEKGKAAKAEAKEQAKAETDEEWFLRECSTLSNALSDVDQYRSDAILWRQIAAERTAFRKKIKKIIEQYREGRRGKRVGWFFLALYRVLNISHPNDWILCGTCNGSGMVDPGDECPRCRGACYDTKCERY
jgi:ParB-like chromosome segregation protein Spo0J